MAEASRGSGVRLVAAGALLVVLSGLAAWPETAEAQEEGSYATPADSGATADQLLRLQADSLPVATGEPFVYPLGGRRDPFRPPVTGEGAGAGFQGLALAGIIYAPETGSVVVIVDRASGRRHRLRVGDRIAGARLVEIGAERAVFRVTEYGSSRRTVLRLRDSQEPRLP